MEINIEYLLDIYNASTNIPNKERFDFMIDSEERIIAFQYNDEVFKKEVLFMYTQKPKIGDN